MRSNWNADRRAAGAHRDAPLQRGGGILWVLVVLTLALGTLIFYLGRQRAPASFLTREQKHRQAFALAEAGIALQLHREQFFDSSQRSGERSDAARALDSLRFFLDSAAPPRVEVNRERAYLEIRSTAFVTPESAGVTARFGRALDPDMFGAALALSNDAPLRPFGSGQVRGSVRLKTPSDGVSSQSLPSGFRGIAYAEAYVDSKYRELEGRLREILAQEGAEPGNGEFTSAFPPRFDQRTEIGFPFGEATLRHDGENYWEVSGPAAIAVRNGIRVRGKVRLKNVTLLSEGEIHLEGEVRAENVAVFAAGALFLLDQVRVEGLLVSGGNVFIRDRARVIGNSLILRSGGNSADSSLAIRLEDEAAVRAMVLASGPAGKIVLSGAQNRVEGVLMAAEIWPAGTIHGCVVANRLICGDAGGKNCLGDAVIDRESLPGDFTQPWDLGLDGNRAKIRFKLLAWETR